MVDPAIGASRGKRRNSISEMSPVRKNAILPSTKVSNTCSSVWTERCPNLNLDRVLAGSDERFDLEVLLEHLEKAFDLPASLIDVADRLCVQLKIVG